MLLRWLCLIALIGIPAFLIGCASGGDDITVMQNITANNTVYQDRIIYQDRIVEKVSPQHFVVTKNVTQYIAYCNTSNNFSALVKKEWHFINGTDNLTVDGVRLQIVGANTDGEILLRVNDGIYKVTESRGVKIPQREILLRQIFISNIGTPKVSAYVEVTRTRK